MTSETPTSSSVVLQSVPGAVDGICKQIMDALTEAGFSQDDLFAVHLAIEEAFQNAVKHGNRMHGEKTVKVEYEVHSDRVQISITDEGPGFDPSDVPDPRAEHNLFKPDGRGVLLINAYMDEVHYNEDGNCISMTRLKKDKSGG